MEENSYKRLFFAFQLAAPWPEKLPMGRLLQEQERHLTVVFVGKANYTKLLNILPSIPYPSFGMGLIGKFDDCLFLPPHHPRVVAWHVDWFGRQGLIESYYLQLVAWLQDNGFQLDIRDHFLSHLTLCRAPFDAKKWKLSFSPLPLVIQGLHLYESMGGLHYEARWSYPLQPPFVELDHTADIAFRIFGENVEQLQQNAWLALTFHCPGFLLFQPEVIATQTIEDVILHLNLQIAKMDILQGSPFKAVSHHGDIKREKNGLLSWEMIVDV